MPVGIMSMFMTKVDPDMENYHAIDYMVLANSFFLGIWEAPEGEEFIIGSNSFGLWEGTLDGAPGLHRVFVVSPRIALILRKTILATDTIENIKNQCSIKGRLIDVPMSVAHCTHAAFRPGDPEEPDTMARLVQYRQTPEAQGDIYTFRPTRLTQQQTYDLNYVILTNLKKDGNLTFASPVAMAKTLRHYLQHNIAESQESKYWLRSLLGILNASLADLRSSTQTPQSGVNVVLDAIANGLIEFPSTYDRAYRVYHLATDNVTAYNQSTSEIHQMTGRAIATMQEILPPLPTAFRYSFFPFLCRDVVKKLPKEESELFFALVGHQVDQFKIGRQVALMFCIASNMTQPLLDSLTGWQKIDLGCWMTFCHSG